MAMLNQIDAIGLDMLWYQCVQDLCTGNEVDYNFPNVFKRFTIGSASKIGFENSEVIKDFFRFSHYTYKMKMAQLSKDYLDDRVISQLDLVKNNLRSLHPRQARAVVYFSRDAYDSKSKLKCLESMYFQKQDMTTFSAYMIFRNTELFPKTMMDFFLAKRIIREVERASGCKCLEYNAIMMNSFISVHWAGMTAMFLKRWGLSNWNPSFKKLLEQFERKFGDPEVVETLKMQSIKRTVTRFHSLREELGVSVEEVCQ